MLHNFDVKPYKFNQDIQNIINVLSSSQKKCICINKNTNKIIGLQIYARHGT